MIADYSNNDVTCRSEHGHAVDVLRLLVNASDDKACSSKKMAKLCVVSGSFATRLFPLSERNFQ